MISLHLILKNKIYTVRVYRQINDTNNLPISILTIDDSSFYYFPTSTFPNITERDVFSLYIRANKDNDFNYRSSYLSGYRLLGKIGKIS